MPRISVDDTIETDARWLLLARDLGAKVQHVAGEAIFVWQTCYGRMSPYMSAEEIDARADRDGFAAALIRRGLADHTPQGIRLRGVADRIKYLLDQRERGRQGGLKRSLAERTRDDERQAVASGSLKPPSVSPSAVAVASPEKQCAAAAPPPPPGELVLTPPAGRNGDKRAAERERVRQVTEAVIGKLNRDGGRHFEAGPAERLVAKLLRLGHTEKQMRAVVWHAVQLRDAGKLDPEYVRPATLLKVGERSTRDFAMRFAEAKEAWIADKRDRKELEG